MSLSPDGLNDDQPADRPHRRPVDDNVRCMCGSLLARLVPGGVELKCRRCKCTVVLPLLEQPGA